MEREIKFRAWYDGKMYEVFGMNFSDQRCCIPLLRFPFSQEVYVDSIMQYTGLKDKNGKEIYEGDVVVQHPGFGCEWGQRKGTVVYNYASFWFEGDGWDTILDHHDCSFEIIGNIHENPELLK